MRLSWHHLGLIWGAVAMPMMAMASKNDVVDKQPHPIWQQQDEVPEGFDTYLRWKKLFLKTAPCQADEIYVNSSKDAGKPGDITVSEAHGYGMLLLATMAPFDQQAHAQFDGMVRLMKRHRVSAKTPLMIWRLDEACQSDKKETSAPDGDLDMAYALLLADKHWGSSAERPYRQLARERIDAIMNQIVHGKDTNKPFVALWENIAEGQPYDLGTRLSDIMPNHFRAFYRATGDKRWMTLLQHGYELLAQLQKQSKTGLIPDFAIVKNNGIRPAPEGYLEGSHDGEYYYNACRLPWRLAVDVDPHKRGRIILERLSESLLACCEQDPAKLMDGYNLAGEATSHGQGKLAILAPAALLVDRYASAHKLKQSWLRYIETDWAEPQSYYNETLRVLAVVRAGSWAGED